MYTCYHPLRQILRDLLEEKKWDSKWRVNYGEYERTLEERGESIDNENT